MSEIEGSIQFEVLGPIRLRIGGAEITVSARRDRIMLAMLLLHAPDPVPLSRLVEAVWEDQPPHNSRNQVQACISRWRKQFADAGAQRQVIVTDQAGYRIPARSQDLDLLEFRRLRDEARSAAADGQAKDAYDHYRSALGLWRGPTAMAGIDSALVRRVTTALDEEHVQAHEESLRLALDHNLGEPGALVAELQELVRQHPYREALQADLLRALYRAGRQADALAAYREFRQRLNDELGTEPGDDLQRLHRAVLNRDPMLDVPKPPAAPATTAQPVPRELPAQVPGFAGRTEVLATLDDLLSGQSTGTPGPLVISAIAGTAGVGKTALAVHWAHRVADHFPDGQLYLNLRGYDRGPPVSPAEALAALLRSLGVPSEQIPTDREQAAALLRTRLADRRALLVLDNARSVDHIRPLLPGSPSCLVLITSRNRLSGLVAREGARRIDLDVLPPDEAHTLLRYMLGAQRVDTEPDAVAELAAACAHLPLALRIAAAHLAERPARSVASYVAELTTGDRLGVLQADGDPESSVLAALTLSYQTLPTGATRLFGLLGLVPGPDFTPAAAAALADTTVDKAARNLRQLATAHIVEEMEPGRYTFHDLLRLYARRLVEAGENEKDRDSATRRLADHYLHAADAAASRLYPERLRLPMTEPSMSPPAEFDQPADALAWLDSEQANLIAIVVHAAGHGPRAAAWLIADSLRGYYWHRRHVPEWATMARAALAAAEQEGNAQAQAAALISLADEQQVCAANYDAALTLYSEAAERARQANWGLGQAGALSNLGIVCRILGRLETASEAYARALVAFQRGGYVPGQATVSTNLGTVYRVLGKLHRAVESHRHAISLYRQIGSASGEATALRNLGEANHQLGRMTHAYGQLTQALDLYRQVGNRSGEASTLDSLAAADRDAGRITDAMNRASESAALASEVGDHQTEAAALGTLGSVELALGHSDDALRHYQAALSLTRNGGSHYHETHTRLGLADAYRQRGDHRAASEEATAVLGRAVQFGYRMLEGVVQTLLAEVCLDLNRRDEARDHVVEALKSHRATGHRHGEARALAVLGHIRYAMDDRHAASHLWAAAADLFAAIGARLPAELQPPDPG